MESGHNKKVMVEIDVWISGVVSNGIGLAPMTVVDMKCGRVTMVFEAFRAVEIVVSGNWFTVRLIAVVGAAGMVVVVVSWGSYGPLTSVRGVAMMINAVGLDSRLVVTNSVAVVTRMAISVVDVVIVPISVVIGATVDVGDMNRNTVVARVATEAAGAKAGANPSSSVVTVIIEMDHLFRSGMMHLRRFLFIQTRFCFFSE